MKKTVQHNGLVRLPHRAIIRITGGDALDFLQGQLSCDLRELTETQARVAVYCDHKGRVIASFYVCRIIGGYDLLLDKGLVRTVMERLQKYSLMADVRLQEMVHDVMGLIVGDEALPDDPLFEHLPAKLDAFHAGQWGWVIKVAEKPERYLYALPQASATRLLGAGFTQLTTIDWEFFDIRDGMAHVHASISGLFTPHMLNFHQRNAISFSKGCFVGQEIIARTQHLGRLKRRLCQLSFEAGADITPPQAVYNPQGQPVGQIINVCHHPTHKGGVALAVIHESACSSDLYLNPDRVLHASLVKRPH